MHRSTAAIAPTKETDFRWVLREETQGAHDALDQLISRLDLASQADFITFMQVHQFCFAAMAQQANLDGLDRMVEAISDDLSGFAEVPTLNVSAQLFPFHILAGRYILAGSRMGTKVLAKRWRQSEDERVRAANSYFTLPTDGTDWKAVCAELSQVPPQTALAAEIIADTRRLFQFFQATVESVTAQAH